MTTREPPSGTVTFLFTDIESSTWLLQHLGDSLLEPGYGAGEGPYFNYDDSIGADVDLDYYWGLTFEVGSLDQAARALGDLGIGFGEVFSGDGRRIWLDSLQLSEHNPLGELYIAFRTADQ